MVWMLMGTGTNRGIQSVSGNISQGSASLLAADYSNYAQVAPHMALPLFKRWQYSLAQAYFIIPHLFICAADLELRW